MSVTEGEAAKREGQVKEKVGVKINQKLCKTRKHARKLHFFFLKKKTTHIFKKARKTCQQQFPASQKIEKKKKTNQKSKLKRKRSKKYKKTLKHLDGRRDLCDMVCNFFGEPVLDGPHCIDHLTDFKTSQKHVLLRCVTCHSADVDHVRDFL